MSQALAFDRTVPAYPLGKRLDGKFRYGMTPEMAIFYRWLVQHKPHDKPFTINSRAIAPLFLLKAHTGIVRMVNELIARGWLQRDDAGYRLVQPVMIFKPSKGN